MSDELWTALMNLYPYGMQAFTQWIQRNHKGVQFLQQPRYAQIGLWIEFCIDEVDMEEGWQVDLATYDWHVDFFTTIKMLHEHYREEDDEND